MFITNRKLSYSFLHKDVFSFENSEFVNEKSDVLLDLELNSCYFWMRHPILCFCRFFQ